MNLTGMTRYNFERKEQNVDRKSVLTNLKSHDGLWGSKNYPLRKEEADVIIEALEEGDTEAKIKPVPVKERTPIGIDVELGVCSNCEWSLSDAFDYCPHCGRKLDWSVNNG